MNNISEHFNFSPSTIKDILNQNKIQYFERILVTPLTNDHKQKHFEICKKIIAVPYLRS